MFRIVAFSLLALACFVWAPCFALTAPCHVTNFTPDGNYYFLYLDYLYNGTTETSNAVASKFKTGSATSYPLYSVSVQLLGYFPQDYLVSIEIYADNGGLPGASLGGFTAPPKDYEINATVVTLTLSSDTPIDLDSDTDYWLAVKGGGLSSNSWLGTNINYTDPTDGSIFYIESVSYLPDNGTWDDEQNVEGLMKLGYCKPSASPSRSPSKKSTKSPSPKKATVTPSPSHKKASASPSHKVSPKKTGKQSESPSPSEVVHHSASPSHKVSVKKSNKPSESKSPSKKAAKSPSKKKKKKKEKKKKKKNKKKKKG